MTQLPPPEHLQKMAQVQALTDAIILAKTALRKFPGPSKALDLQRLLLRRTELLATMPLRIVE